MSPLQSAAFWASEYAQRAEVYETQARTAADLAAECRDLAARENAKLATLLASSSVAEAVPAAAEGAASGGAS